MFLPTATDDWTFFFQVVIRGGSDLAGTLRPEKKRTVDWPSMFFSGFKLQPEKIMTEKKSTVELSDRPFFQAGSNYNQKKLRQEKKGCTVVWPMEAAQICGNVTTGKKRKKLTVVWPAMFFIGVKLQMEKITTEKKGTVVWPTFFPFIVFSSCNLINEETRQKT